MTAFDDRYKNLNEEQRQAVDLVDGPLLVVAGPGTGKTELLSMRVANILKKTDTSPENILCLTFTESGATAMRSRLSDIIGPQAYKVAIQTFHSFGTETINQNREYFYRGAEFQPADDIASYDILTNIFDELDYSSPLASKNNGEYVHLSDTLKAIGELKQAGLSSDELIAILDANDRTLDAIEQDLTDIFANRPSVSMLSMLVPIAEKAASLPVTELPSAITPLANELALSMARAFDEAVEINKTTPITAWRDEWLEKDTTSHFVFKDRKRHAKLRALAHVYFSYISRMEQASLYDYNDMILNVVHSMELHADLKANLQEKYQYILVDEFQDTNLAQLRILFNLTDNPLGDEPNVMAVGDDDQAIYSFQGADVNNINRFREQYPSHRSIVLTHNYRSSEPILKASREVITQADGRLETIMDINKTLTPHADASHAKVSRTKLPTRIDENDWVASTIAAEIKSGVKPNGIAVLARNHTELIALVPYLHHYGIAIDYERRDNILDKENILALELLAETAVAIFGGDHDLADSKLPELLSHPMFAIPPETIWRLSLQAHRSGLTWLETMLNTPDLRPLADWLITRAQAVPHETLEVFVDVLIGASSKTEGYVSPYHQHYFSTNILNDSPEDYLSTLEALRTLRTKLREYRPNDTLHIADMLEFIRMHRELGARIMTIRSGVSNSDAVHLMTSHKSKGLEFDTVFIINSMDGRWGERVRSRSSLINYPENLRIRPNSNSYNERLRLYFVAMTRAKRQLFISYSATDTSGKDVLPAGFLSGTAINEQVVIPEHSVETLTTLNNLDWQDYITNQPTATMKALLEPTLENYKLSATHLNNFIDLTHGGPSMFLMNNLLRFPAAKSASASYGTA
ncbi:MAG TPA: ATP-dependent helicase, partial [Patescibacteria group bacterium]|nr:ATP-dependent helicase [Patescibacteria group bacterium]